MNFTLVQGRTINLEVVFGTKVKELTSASFWLEHFKLVMQKLGLTYIDSIHTTFESKNAGEEGGISVVCILLESHLAVHTWPEYNYAHIVLDSCKWNIEGKTFIETVLAPFEGLPFEYKMEERLWF